MFEGTFSDVRLPRLPETEGPARALFIEWRLPEWSRSRVRGEGPTPGGRADERVPHRNRLHAQAVWLEAAPPAEAFAGHPDVRFRRALAEAATVLTVRGVWELADEQQAAVPVTTPRHIIGDVGVQSAW